MTLPHAITSFVDQEFGRETAFLAELVKVASDNPPGDCAPHAARAKQLAGAQLRSGACRAGDGRA